MRRRVIGPARLSGTSGQRAARRDRVERLQHVVAPDADRLAMDQQLVARLQRLVAQRIEARRAGCALVSSVTASRSLPGELQPQQRESSFAARPSERGGDLLDDLLLQRRLRLLDVEAPAQPVEVRALVSAVLAAR